MPPQTRALLSPTLAGTASQCNAVFAALDLPARDTECCWSCLEVGTLFGIFVTDVLMGVCCGHVQELNAELAAREASPE